MAIKLHPSMAVHPGPWLRRNAVDPHGLSVTDAAGYLGVTRAPLSNLLNGKAALSVDMSLRFEKVFGLPAATLLKMQTAHDLAQAREHADTLQTRRVPELA